jgi:SOS-response transcriptional repressor LexA
MTERLAKREVQILAFIRRHSSQFGRAPYQHEIAASLGLKSCSYVQRVLQKMITKGVIVKANRAKAWTLLPGTQIADTEGRDRVLKLLAPDTRSIVESYARAEGASVETIIAEWVGERARHEAEAKARAA